MIRLLFVAFVIFAMLGTLIQAESEPPNDALPLAHADFPVCVTVKPPPPPPNIKRRMPSKTAEIS